MRPRALTIAYLVAVLLITSIESRAQSTAPLSAALRADGTVQSSVPGSFDASGYRLAFGRNGEPRFVDASQLFGTGCADSWDTSFTIGGADSSISVVVTDGAGNLYVGGWFSSINGVAASGIAKWDGVSWSALGSGVSGASGAGGVQAIAVSGSDVYVGGDFSVAGGAPALHVAKWNGSSWSAMGAGLGASGGGPQVYAMAVSGTSVYAGGQFQDAGNLNYIARWDGSSWVSMGTGMNSEVRAIAVSGSDVYAGGAFTMAGGNPASRMAKWDGTAWSAMQAGAISSVRAIALSGTDIYIGSSSGLLKWNGTGWTQLGSISNGVSSGLVRSITFQGSDVYIGGEFVSVAGVSANRMAKWNGSSWSSLGSGIGDTSSHAVSSIAFLGSSLFAGGSFPVAGGISARNIATWNGSAWSSSQGTGLTGEVSAIAVSGTDVYVAGNFIGAGSVVARRIAKWNSVTNTWSALGTGVTTGSINALAVAGNKLYAGGNFSSIGGVSANNIAVWNGTSWSALGSGVTGGVVFAIAVQGENVYVGGDLQTAGGQPAWRIARWNGTAWSGMNSSTGIIAGGVVSILPVGNDVYVGSGYTLVDGPNYFNKYDGTTWTALGTGMTGGGVNSLAYDGTDFYVAGGFTAVGGISAARIARWNGTTWSALGSGLPGSSGDPFRIAMSGSDMIAVGGFTTGQGSPHNYVTRWNGSSWLPLGSGLNGRANAVAVAGGDIFVGGQFTRAGCNTSPYFARWRETLWTGTTNTDWHTTTNWGSGSVPAPGAGVTISTSDAAITSADVTLDRLIVTSGRTLTIGAGRTLTITRDLDVSNGNFAGSGSVVVNGNVNLNGGSIAGLGSLTVNGDLNVYGGSVALPGTVVVNGNLRLDGGNATGVGSIVANGTLRLANGKITGPGTVTVTSCNPGAIIGGSVLSFVESPLQRCVNSSGVFVFPVGTGSAYAPVELANVSGSANVTIEPKAGAYSGAASGLPANRLLRWWQITNGGISQADVTFIYNNSDVVGSEIRNRVYRIDGGTATRTATNLNTTTNRATVVGVTSSSSWTMAEAVSVVGMFAGRITGASGRPDSRAIVQLTDESGVSRFTRTNPFGYYRFPDTTTIRTYTLRVRSKFFTYTPNPRTIVFDDVSSNIDIVATNF